MDVFETCVRYLFKVLLLVYGSGYALRPSVWVVPLISDIVTNGELPTEVRNDPDAWAECIAGAIDEEEYLKKIADAGFEDIHVLSKKSYTDRIYSAEIEANKPAGRT